MCKNPLTPLWKCLQWAFQIGSYGGAASVFQKAKRPRLGPPNVFAVAAHQLNTP